MQSRINAQPHTMQSSASPQITLSTLCYKLRSENEDLIETVSLKTGLVESCEKEISVLKQRLSELESKMNSESEQSIAEKMDIGNERLTLMQENSRMDSRLRQSESRCESLQDQLAVAHDKVEILLAQLQRATESHASTEALLVPQPDASVTQLVSENARLQKELETMNFIHSELDSRSKRLRVEDDLNASIVSVTDSVADLLPTFTISSEDSLLRLFESLVGFSIVKAGNVVTLVSQSRPDVVVRLTMGDDGVPTLLGSENVSESALSEFSSNKSISSLLAKITLF